MEGLGKILALSHGKYFAGIGGFIAGYCGTDLGVGADKSRKRKTSLETSNSGWNKGNYGVGEK